MLRIDKPNRFDMTAVWEINIIAAVSMPIITLFSFGGLLLFVGFMALGLLMGKWFYFPLGLLCGCLGGISLPFLPLIQVNPFVRHIIHTNAGPVSDSRDSHDFQVAMTPRLYTGLRGFSKTPMI